MSTIQLPGGETAEIVDVEGITGYAEQVVTDVIAAAGDGDDLGRAGAAWLHSRVELIPHVVVSWSLRDPDGTPLPITLDAVMRLPRSIRRALIEATRPLHEEITRDFSAATPDPKAGR